MPFHEKVLYVYRKVLLHEKLWQALFIKVKIYSRPGNFAISSSSCYPYDHLLASQQLENLTYCRKSLLASSTYTWNSQHNTMSTFNRRIDFLQAL